MNTKKADFRTSLNTMVGLCMLEIFFILIEREKIV